MGHLARFQPRTQVEGQLPLPVTHQEGRQVPATPPQRAQGANQADQDFWPQKWQIPVSNLATGAPGPLCDCSEDSDPAGRVPSNRLCGLAHRLLAQP